MFTRRDPGLPRPLALKSSSTFRAADATDDAEAKERLLREAQSLAAHSALADAYTYLQKAVGLIAVTLPFVVAIGHKLSGGDTLKGSISAYYYTHLGNTSLAVSARWESSSSRTTTGHCRSTGWTTS